MSIGHKHRFGSVEVLSQNGDTLNYNGYTPTYKELPSYDHLIARATGTTTHHGSKGLDFTIDEIKRVIKAHHSQVTALARHLYSSNVGQACFNVWHFIKRNIRYDFDPQGKEDIRTPARVWRDRLSQNDCEDYTIFACSLLMEMGYKPIPQIVAFNHSENYQHIFPVCQGFTVDAVLNKFNENPKGITKVMKVNTLNGVPATEDTQYFNGIGGIKPITPTTARLMAAKNGLIERIREAKAAGRVDAVAEKELRKVRNLIEMSGTDEQEVLMEVMQYVSDVTKDGQFVFRTPADAQKFEVHLAQIEKDHAHAEALFGEDAIGAIQDAFQAEADAEESVNERNAYQLGSITDEEHDLGKKSKAQKKTDRKVKQQKRQAKKAPKKAARKAATKKRKEIIKKGLKKIGTKVSNTVKKVVKAVKKYNPLSVAGRNAFLGLVQLNFKGLATKMSVGYMTPADAKRFGYSDAEYAAAVRRKDEGEKKWKDMGGNPEKLRGAINRGKAKGKQGKKAFKNTTAAKTAALKKNPAARTKTGKSIIKRAGKLRGVESWDEVEQQMSLGLVDGVSELLIAAGPILAVFLKLFGSAKARDASGEPVDFDSEDIPKTGNDEIDRALEVANQTADILKPSREQSEDPSSEALPPPDNTSPNIPATDNGYKNAADKAIADEVMSQAPVAQPGDSPVAPGGDEKGEEDGTISPQTAGIGTGGWIGLALGGGGLLYLMTRKKGGK